MEAIFTSPYYIWVVTLVIMYLVWDNADMGNIEGIRLMALILFLHIALVSYFNYNINPIIILSLWFIGALVAVVIDMFFKRFYLKTAIELTFSTYDPEAQITEAEVDSVVYSIMRSSILDGQFFYMTKQIDLSKCKTYGELRRDITECIELWVGGVIGRNLFLWPVSLQIEICRFAWLAGLRTSGNIQSTANPNIVGGRNSRIGTEVNKWLKK